MRQPHLRLAPPEGAPSAPCPPGWAAAPAGTWRGAPVEVVFDPDRHTVVFLRGSSETVTRALVRAGFTCWDRDGQAEMWVSGLTARRPTPSRVRSRRLVQRG